MVKNENNLAFPVANSKGECLNGSEGLTKLEYASIKLLSGFIASPFDIQESEMVNRSFEMAKELFKQIEEQNGSINKTIKQPKREDYGWQDGGIGEETGWMLEGGEEAYYKALHKFNSKNEDYYEELQKQNSELNGKLQTAINMLISIESSEDKYINNIRPLLKATINTLKK